MIGPDAARGLLRNEGWLSHTPERFRDAVLSKATLKRYAAGATIVTVGEEPRGLFGLAEGGLRVAIAPADSGPLFAHFFQPGSWFGEVPALTGQHYVVALAAARETTLLHLSNHALNDILREDPSCWRYLGQLAVTHLETAMGLVADLMRRDHTKRFTAILMRLAGCRNSLRAGTASTGRHRLQPGRSGHDRQSCAHDGQRHPEPIAGEQDRRSQLPAHSHP